MTMRLSIISMIDSLYIYGMTMSGCDVYAYDILSGLARAALRIGGSQLRGPEAIWPVLNPERHHGR
eukprot:SAG31_NODE_1065_length_10096_cov_7.151530_13_plen_66_part_00